MKYYIYILVNKINKKRYVGFSTSPIKRWRSEKSAAFNKKSPKYKYPLSLAIRKYGWDNFDKVIIEQYSDKELAIEAEIYWINHLKTNVINHGRLFGYNCTDGGNTGTTIGRVPWNKGSKGICKPNIGSFVVGKDPNDTCFKPNHTPYMKGKKHKESSILLMSESMKGKIPWNKGVIGAMPVPWNKGTVGLVKPPPNKKITDEQVIEIRNSNLTISDLSRHYKVARKTIRYYKNKK